MIDLLPQREKETLTQEENLKLVLILGIIFLISLTSLALMLFSIKTYISGQVEAQKILLTQKEQESLQIQELEEKVKESNLILSNLNSFYQESSSVTEILEKISKTLPSGTYLSTLNFSPLADEEEKYLAQISLSGFSPNREILLEFKKNLEVQDAFEEIYFPPSNWVKPTDIYFSVKFKILK